VTRQVAAVCEAVRDLWDRRETNRLRAQNTETVVHRDRHIFYDTDMMHESQKETVRVCAQCAGALRIDSSSSRGKRVLAVHIPRKACAACREMASQWYAAAAKDQFDHIFLQDRTGDLYEERR
jgi:hypothetical protein